MNSKYLLAPLRLVSFLEGFASFRSTDAKRSPMWYLAFRACFLIASLFHRRGIFSRATRFSRHNRQLHSGGRMSRMIVSTHNILQNIERRIFLWVK